MAYENLSVNDENGVRWIAVNRPTKLNALNREVLADLDAALTEAVAAPGPRDGLHVATVAPFAGIGSGAAGRTTVP